MKTSVEITVKSLSLSGIPEKVLWRPRNMLTVQMVWPVPLANPQRGKSPRKSESTGSLWYSRSDIVKLRGAVDSGHKEKIDGRIWEMK